MKIAVLGTGTVGQAVAGKLSDLGHDVVVGTRDPQATLARTEPDGMGNPPFTAWHGRSTRGIALATFAEAAAQARAHRQCHHRRRLARALEPAGAENLAGKVLIDIANPLDFSAGLPAHPVRQGHRLPRRADPARLPGGPGREVAQHDERGTDGRSGTRGRRRPLASSSPATTPPPRRPSSSC